MNELKSPFSHYLQSETFSDAHFLFFKEMILNLDFIYFTIWYIFNCLQYGVSHLSDVSSIQYLQEIWTTSRNVTTFVNVSTA